MCRSDYVQVGDTVEIDLTMKKVDGTLIQTSVEEIATAYGRTTKQVNDVLAFNPGRGQVIRGLDELTLGAKLGQHKGALIDSHDAYGAYQSDKIVTFSTSSLPAEIQVADKDEKVLMFVEIEGEEKLVLGTVTDKTSTSATVDFNHMLAGEDLVIYIHIMKLFKVCN